MTPQTAASGAAADWSPIKSDSRMLQAPTLPPGTSFTCPAGEQPFAVGWDGVTVQADAVFQTVQLPNGMYVDLGLATEGDAEVKKFEKKDGYLKFSVTSKGQPEDLVQSGVEDPSLQYPKSYATLSIRFHEPLSGLSISIGDIDSNAQNSDATRIRMQDAAGVDVPVKVTANPGIAVNEAGGFAYEKNAGRGAKNPGFDVQMYGTTQAEVETLYLDQSFFIFKDNQIGNRSSRSVFPALTFNFCSPTEPPSLSPITPEPTPEPTPAPVTAAPVTPAPVDIGVSGDPLIMGLTGQLFKFDGRNGAWYSAVSSKSFQWNMKINEYDNCPADSNKFVSGVGFTLFKKNPLTGSRVPAHQIAVNVVNEWGTSTGCGTEATNCLGNGSLELVIDGSKYVYPGDYQLKDGTGRVVAFNTFYECSRKWYDFDITPVEENPKSSRSLRRLSTFPGVFDVVRDLENTMVNKDVCDEWIAERQAKNDLFHQAGAWSTIIVKTEDISFHIEYKQETKRCDAHTVDVWISSVSPDLYDEEWEGVIGETKDPANHPGEKVERSEFLKFPKDEQYEVVSPFAHKCDGCIKH